MFLALVIIHPVPDDVAKVVDILASTRSILATEAGGGEIVYYLERWATRAALERHLRSPLYGRVLEAMELSGKRPTVEFFEIGALGGLEMVERVRLVAPPAVATSIDHAQSTLPETKETDSLFPGQPTCRLRQWP